MTREVCQAAQRIIKDFESLSLKPYHCPAGLVTIGWGHVLSDEKGAPLSRFSPITMERAEELFQEDLAEKAADVESLLDVEVTDNQFGALVSFAFNVGGDIDADDKAEGLGDSTLLRKLNRGDVGGAAAEFPKWNKSQGKVLNGLTRRRLAEQALFLSA